MVYKLETVTTAPPVRVRPAPPHEEVDVGPVLTVVDVHGVALGRRGLDVVDIGIVVESIGD